MAMLGRSGRQQHHTPGPAAGSQGSVGPWPAPNWGSPSWHAGVAQASRGALPMLHPPHPLSSHPMHGGGTPPTFTDARSFAAAAASGAAASASKPRPHSCTGRPPPRKERKNTHKGG